MTKISEAYKPGKAKDTFKINIPITIPGKEKNVNGVTFEMKSYVEVMNSPYVKEVFGNNSGLPLTLTSDFYKAMYIPTEEWIGKVIDWTINVITVEITPDNYNRYVAPFNGIANMKAGILGYGDFVTSENEKEKVFALQKIVGFQLLYGKDAMSYPLNIKEKVEE